MASSTIALSKQLKHELAQQIWLRQNLPRTKQQVLLKRHNHSYACDDGCC